MQELIVGVVAGVFLLCDRPIKGFIRQAGVHYRRCVSPGLLGLDKPHSDQGHILPAVSPGPH